MAEGGSSAGPPDLISDMVQPVDLVNSVTRWASPRLTSPHLASSIVQLPTDPLAFWLIPCPSLARPAVVSLAHQMPVDIVGDLPLHPAGDSPGAGGDTVGDQMDARWFSRGTAASGGPSGGHPPPSLTLTST